MTKRAAGSTHRLLNTTVVITGIVASLLGAHLLQWQDHDTALAASNAPQVESSTTIHLPKSLVQQGGGEPLVIELAPIPTVAAQANVPLARPVARSRSSR